jgi:hypothetical protein
MLLQTVEKLLAETRQKELKEQIEILIPSLTSESKVDDCWNVFKLALLDSQTRILALSLLQKLTAHVLISGTDQGNEAIKPEWEAISKDFTFLNDLELEFTLLDEMILLISQIAFKQENPDVQLQVLHFD